ncbi:MAG: hypothetical protein KatS3mg129_1132 [Leptospiraceae bacterium]|nr:MAG: hypothetical protein KatS3mg129_1132 [Leptospiraceae bacterium]
MSRLLFFQLMFFSILILLILFEYLIYKRWKNRILSIKYKKIFSSIYWFIAISTKIGLLFFFYSRRNFYIEVEGILKPLYYFLLSWNYAFFFAFIVWFLSFIVLYAIYYIFFYIKNRVNSRKKIPDAQENTITRKAFLVSSAGLILDTTPFLATGINFSGMYLGSKDFVSFNKPIKIDNLHPVFQNFKIVHISDLHIGSLINEVYLKPTIEIIKSLKPDIIVVTGDILDNSNLYLPTVGWYFRKLNEIAPVYAILGNHDHIDSPIKLIKTLKLTGTTILVNGSTYINRNKHKINIIGLDYPIKHFESKKTRAQLSEEYFEQVYKNMPYKDNPTIVLNHHPSEFSYLKKKPVQLVLSGHTHGGQIILSENRNSPLSIASNFVKYYVDLYTEEGVHLYVNRGLGHWFPLRINCPPEITLIELY